jgi:hypothetical protein
MSDTPAPPPAETPPPEEPRKRGWFVVLAWVTLVGFGIFTAAITVLSFLIERFARR